MDGPAGLTGPQGPAGTKGPEGLQGQKVNANHDDTIRKDQFRKCINIAMLAIKNANLLLNQIT